MITFNDVIEFTKIYGGWGFAVILVLWILWAGSGDDPKWYYPIVVKTLRAQLERAERDGANWQLMAYSGTRAAERVTASLAPSKTDGAS